MRYIESRYADIRSLDEIAGFCNVTRSHLARLFRSTLHVTLQEYLINYRMGKAKELLVNTNLPIYQIAQQVGYEGALQFNKAFKNRMQVPPRTWRLQNRLRLSGDPDENKICKNVRTFLFTKMKTYVIIGDVIMIMTNQGE